jgi:RNA polymerase sigma factor (sigma-70 family)
LIRTHEERARGKTTGTYSKELIMSAGALPPSRPDDDLSGLPDETLIVLAHDEQCLRARETIILRYCSVAEHLAVKWVRRARLREAETPDAKQTALLALLEALQAFDPAHVGPSCCFCTFMWNFVTARLSNFVRKVRRLELRRGYRQSSDGSERPENDRWRSAISRATVNEREDPVLILEARELADGLESVLGGLRPIERLIWQQGFVSAKKQCVLARELGLSGRTLKRRCAALLRKLVARLYRHIQGRDCPDQLDGERPCCTIFSVR